MKVTQYALFNKSGFYLLILKNARTFFKNVRTFFKNVRTIFKNVRTFFEHVRTFFKIVLYNNFVKKRCR